MDVCIFSIHATVQILANEQRSKKKKDFDFDRPRRRNQGDKDRKEQSMCEKQVRQVQSRWILEADEDRAGGMVRNTASQGYLIATRSTKGFCQQKSKRATTLVPPALLASLPSFPPSLSLSFSSSLSFFSLSACCYSCLKIISQKMGIWLSWCSEQIYLPYFPLNYHLNLSK